jgi:hypothetical protein
MIEGELQNIVNKTRLKKMLLRSNISLLLNEKKSQIAIIITHKKCA